MLPKDMFLHWNSLVFHYLNISRSWCFYVISTVGFRFNAGPKRCDICCFFLIVSHSSLTDSLSPRKKQSCVLAKMPQLKGVREGGGRQNETLCLSMFVKKRTLFRGARLLHDNQSRQTKESRERINEGKEKWDCSREGKMKGKYGWRKHK